ncbi:hypothetical protein P7C70_g8868, partial [Phenoliferia sp. Uapishka_3]
MPPKDLSKSLQRTLTHLRPPPVKGGKFAMPIPTHFRPTPRFVQVKDRIPFWHIAPNDTVVVIKGGAEVKGKSGTVDRVDRETNRVYLKQSDFQAKKRIASEYPMAALSPSHNPDAIATVSRPFHISNIRLEARSAGDTYTVSRMKRTTPTWDRNYRRFAWKRFGFVRELVGEDHDGWIAIPWPKELPEPSSIAGPLDSTSETAFSSTFNPLLSTLTPSSLTDLPTADELKISALDLNGGYHSRAARTKRFNDKKWEVKEFGKERRKVEIEKRLGERESVELA